MPPSPFRYHMTDSPLGLIFNGYSTRTLIPQAQLESLLVEGAREVGEVLSLHPELAREILYADMEVRDEAEEVWLKIEPAREIMTLGDLMRVFPVLAGWAQRYQADDCYFDIFAWPGAADQRFLGTGYLMHVAS